MMMMIDDENMYFFRKEHSRELTRTEMQRPQGTSKKACRSPSKTSRDRQRIRS